MFDEIDISIIVSGVGLLSHIIKRSINGLAVMIDMEAKEAILFRACFPSFLLGEWIGTGVLYYIITPRISKNSNLPMGSP